MPAATNRTDLISIIEKEYTKLTTLLSKVDATIAKQPFDDGTSIKDVIGHRAIGPNYSLVGINKVRRLAWLIFLPKGLNGTS